MGDQPTIFISYSRADKKWKEHLLKHLKVLQRQEALDVWDDGRIKPGTNWKEEITKAMNCASVAVLLVSADFLASEFVTREEVPRLLERRHKEGLKLYPIQIKPCLWKKVGWLSAMQMRHADRALSGRSVHEREEALTAIATEIHAALEDATSERPEPLHDQPELPLAAKATASAGGILTRLGFKGPPHTPTPKTDHDRIQELKTAGRMPQLVLSHSRTWDQSAGNVRFNIGLRNHGRVAVTDLMYMREGITPFRKLSEVLGPSAGTTLSFTMNLPKIQQRVTERLVFRYCTEFGDDLEEVYNVAFDPTASMSPGRGKGVSIERCMQRVVTDIEVGRRDDMSTRIRHFRDERLTKIAEGETPVVLKSSPKAKVVMHVLPFAAMDSGYTIDLAAIKQPPRPMHPINDYPPRYNGDGLVVFGDTSEGPYRTYLQIFHSGIVEAVVVHTHVLRDDVPYYSPWLIERHILESLDSCIGFYKNQHVEPPFFVAITLLQFKGAYVPFPDGFTQYEGTRVADRDKLLLPEVLIHDYSSALPPQMRPAFNILWQSANLPRSLNYAEDGTWDGDGFNRLKSLEDLP